MKNARRILTILGAATAALLLTAFTAEQKMNRELQELIDEREIINVVNGIGTNADRRDWQSVERAFADAVMLDYSSMGAKVETLKPAQLIKNWKTVLPGFKATQHQITNHRISVNGSEADCFSYVTALHYLPNETKNDVWRVVGFYNHHLIKTQNGWRVDKMKFTATIIDGNLDLPKSAMENVKKGERK